MSSKLYASHAVWVKAVFCILLRAILGVCFRQPLTAKLPLLHQFLLSSALKYMGTKSNNRITELHSDALAEQHGLIDLNLSRNLIGSLPKDLLGHAERKQLPLAKLDLSHNLIDSVERTSLFYLTELEEIDLSHNQYALPCFVALSVHVCGRMFFVGEELRFLMAIYIASYL